MGFDIHILGTSSARPTGLRQVSGSVVVCDEGVAIVDAGEGFQSRFAVQRKRMKQYAESQIKVGKVDVLCLTHGHRLAHVLRLEKIVISQVVQV